MENPILEGLNNAFLFYLSLIVAYAVYTTARNDLRLAKHPIGIGTLFGKGILGLGGVLLGSAMIGGFMSEGPSVTVYLAIVLSSALLYGAYKGAQNPHQPHHD